MKILYDHQIFSSQKFGGISRYFYELIKRIGSENSDISSYYSINQYTNSDINFKSKFFFENIKFKGKIRLLNIINEVITKNVIKKKEFDIYHPTYYKPFFLDSLRGKPYIVTVHDMIHEKFKNEFSEDDDSIINKKTVIINASKIIAISNNTKNDLISILGIDEKKIEVIYHGNSMESKKYTKLNSSFPENYFLFVGQRFNKYKNFKIFVKVMSKILKENSKFTLICAGGGKFTDTEISMFKELNIEKRVCNYNIQDELLGQLYSNAIAFIFPSYYEGFGIPILEAFACRCPLICSDTSCFPEIAQDAALYFDPYSEQAIYNTVKTIIDNQDLREILIQRGAKRLKYFSWEKTAKETLQVYKEILK